MNKIDISWKEEYSVGVKRFDDDHKEIIKIISRINDTLYQFKTLEHMPDIFGELKDYAERHFKAEEELMEEHGFPGYEDHKREHEEFDRKIEKLEEEVNTTPRLTTFDLASFLYEWLEDHVLNVDKKYEDFFREKKIT